MNRVFVAVLWVIKGYYKTFFKLAMVAKNKKAMKCTSYFVRKFDVLEQNGTIFGISTPKLLRNKYWISFSKYDAGRCHLQCHIIKLLNFIFNSYFVFFKCTSNIKLYKVKRYLFFLHFLLTTSFCRSCVTFTGPWCSGGELCRFTF